MKLTGILDFSLGNFLCVRGYAPMGVLHDISEPDESFQRDLLTDHKAEMVAFLDEAEFLFFPEVILCATLAGKDESHWYEDSQRVEALRQGIQTGASLKGFKFADFQISGSATKSPSETDIRTLDYLYRVRLDISDTARKFSRIDGNHRLSATPENEKFKRYNAPFCLILFHTPEEAAKMSRALFHNINYKQEPLSMEQNLQLILDDESLFSDDDLKDKPSFGWPYYLARKLRKELDYDYLPHLQPFIEPEPRTFLVDEFGVLIDKGILKAQEKAKRDLKNALSSVNQLFESQPLLRESKNRGLLAALTWYQLSAPHILPLFIDWVLKNHLHFIEKSNPLDLVQIFDKIMQSRGRTIFVSMPFGKNKTDGHFVTIERVCREISDDHGLDVPLRVERVDRSDDGTSFDINAKIIEMMDDCGLLLGNLTYAKPNVYHEIGFVMGKARTLGVAPNILLFLDESVDEADRYVGFNLGGLQQIRFGDGQVDTVFASELRKRIELIFRLTSNN
jgi:hypothetical protein